MKQLDFSFPFQLDGAYMKANVPVKNPTHVYAYYLPIQPESRAWCRVGEEGSPLTYRGHSRYLTQTI